MAPKQPRAARQPAFEKRPRFAVAPSSGGEHPSWQLTLLELAGPYDWRRISEDKLLEIRHKLASLESMTWDEILVAGSKRNHPVPVNELSKAARDRLDQIGQADIDELVSLRLAGRERVWGIRDRAVLRVLWWDPDHQVCPVEKRHT